MWEATGSARTGVARAGRGCSGTGLPSPDGLTSIVALGWAAADRQRTSSRNRRALCPLRSSSAKDYELPRSSGRSTLCSLASFSGEYRGPWRRPPRRWRGAGKLVAVTGAVSSRALGDCGGGTVVHVPADDSLSRAAIGAMAMAPLVVLGRLGSSAFGGRGGLAPTAATPTPAPTPPPTPPPMSMT